MASEPADIVRLHKTTALLMNYLASTSMTK